MILKTTWQPMIEESEVYRTLPGARAEGLIQWLPSVGDDGKAALRKAGFYKVKELKWRIVDRHNMQANILLRVEKGKKTGVFLYGIWVYATDPTFIEWHETPPDIDAFAVPETLHFNFCGYKYVGKMEKRSEFVDEAIHKWRRKNGYER